jgi:hypothetical protein
MAVQHTVKAKGIWSENHRRGHSCDEDQDQDAEDTARAASLERFGSSSQNIAAEHYRHSMVGRPPRA